MGFEGFVGLRYLMAKRQRNVLSVITLISVAGVAVGVMALIVVLSVMGGFEGDLREKIIGTKAHIVVSAKQGHLSDYEAVIDRIVDVEGVVGAAPYVEGEVMINSASNLQGVVLNGIDPERHKDISKLDDNMEAGGLEYLSDPDTRPVDQGLIFQKDPGDPGSPGASPARMRAAAARSTLGFIGSHHGRFVDRALGDEDDLDADGLDLDAGANIPLPDLVPTDDEDDPLDDGDAAATDDVEPAAGDDEGDSDDATSRRGHFRRNDPYLSRGGDGDDTTGAAAADAELAADDGDEAEQGAASDGSDRGHFRRDDPYLSSDDDDETVGNGDSNAADDDDIDLKNGGTATADADGAIDDDDDARPATGTLTGVDDEPDDGIAPIPTVGRRQVDGLVLGLELQDTLAVFLGNEVNVMSPMGDIGPSGSIPRSRPYRVVGVFYSGMYEYDTKYVYTTLESAQRFLNLEPDQVTGIEVRIEDMDNSGEVKALIEAALAGQDNVQVRDWRELNGNLFSALMLEKIAMFVILTFIILVASFSILCLLIMIVIEKGREIAILKAMGASTPAIMRVFMIQGGVIGMLGTAIGCTLGLLLCWVIAGWGIELPADVYYLSHVPVEVRAGEVALICAAAVLISLLATIPPSILAARLDPVDGLRYE